MPSTRPTAVRVPEELLAEIDKQVAPGKRSEFIKQAIEKSLLQLKQQKSLQDAGGTWQDTDYPEFATAQDVETWVRNLRAGNEKESRPRD